MNILILGGSNSLLKNGYVQHMEAALAGRGPVRVRQLSVGATSSLAAIGRLFDTAGEEEPDVILYEYSINDAGHFAWRPDGGMSWLLCLHLLVKAAAQLYPQAVFVPLVFAMRSAASPAVADPFYASQTASFAALALQTIDIRRWLADLFLDHPPAWLYGDEAHYVTPHATTLIGCEIARRLPAIKASAEPLARTWQRLQPLSPHGTLESVYVQAAALARFTSGPVALQHDENRLMRLGYLRMEPGSTLAIHTEMFPLALYLKSDAGHHDVRVTVNGPAFSGSVTTATRHADTGSYRFICTNLPVPLLFGQQLAVPFGPSALELAVAPPRDSAPRSDFDCFVPSPAAPPDIHFDLCGILFVARAA